MLSSLLLPLPFFFLVFIYLQTLLLEDLSLHQHFRERSWLKLLVNLLLLALHLVASLVLLLPRLLPLLLHQYRDLRYVCLYVCMSEYVF